jgi:hypothetical protein
MRLVEFGSSFVRLKPWHMAYGVWLMVPDHMPYAISHRREARFAGPRQRRAKI